MRLIKYYILFVLICILAFIPQKLVSQKVTRISSSARAASMGGASVSYPYDVNVMNYNPAGLGILSETQLSFMHIEWLAHINYEYMAYCTPVSKNSMLGFNFKYLHIPEFAWYDKTGIKQGDLNGNDMAVSIGFSHIPQKLGINSSMGANIKLLRTVLEDYELMSMAADVGIMDQTTLFNKIKFISGFAVRNIGYNFKSPGNNPVTVPIDFAVGGTLEALNLFSHCIMVSLETASDIISLKEMPFRLNSGLEYSFRNLIFLRGGYRYGYSFNGFSGADIVSLPFLLHIFSRSQQHQHN